MSKMLDRTANLQPGAAGDRPSRADSPRSAPGRMFEYTSRINAAEDRAIAAEAQLKDAMALVEQLQAAGNATEAAGAHMVDIDTLVEVPGRRRKLSPTEYEELRSNLAESELINPVVYRARGDGKNEIVSGNNRVAIYRDDLKRPQILGIPFQGDEAQAELGATFSNLLSPALPDFEKYRQFIRLQEEFGFTRADIIKASGLSPTHVRRILMFDELPVAAREAIAQRPDRVGGNAAEDFAALVKDGHEQGVVEAIQQLVADEKITQKKALELAKPKPAKKQGGSAPRATINVGKRKLCDLTVRSGVLAVRFNGKQGEESAEEWADKIEAFIRSQIAESNEKS